MARRTATGRGRGAAAAVAAAALAAASLLLSPALPRAAAQAPPPGLWSYSVALAGGGVQLVWPAVPDTAPSDYTLRGCGPASGPGDVSCPGAAPATQVAPPAPLCAGCPFLAATVAGPAPPARLVVALTMGGTEVAAAPPVAPAADASAAFTFFASPAPHGADAPGCGSWASPCATPAAALAAAAAAAPAAPAAVWLAPGLYTLTAPLTFGGRPHALGSLAGKAVTYLDGGPASATRLLEFRAGEGPATVVRGLTLARGHAGADPADAGGGCVLIDSASPTLADLDLVGCSTCTPDASACNGNGGGVLVKNSANLWGPGGVPLVAPRLLSVSISQCLAANGGGLFAIGAGLILAGLSISQCGAVQAGAGAGGGLYAEAGYALGGGLAIDACGAAFTGGGLHASGFVTLDAGTLAPGPLPAVSITRNVAGTFSGGVSCVGALLAFGPGAAIDANAAGYFAGGVLVLMGSVSLVGPASTISSNVGPYGGGGAYLASGALALDGVTLADNTAYNGAGVMVSRAAGVGGGATASLAGSTFVRNTATGLAGGALQVISCTAVSVTDCVFESNVAVKGGGANVNQDGGAGGGGGGGGGGGADPDPAAPAPVSFARTAFRSNVAQYGGGLHVSLGGDVSLVDCVFDANTARAAGGGAAVGDGGTLRATGTTWAGNGNFSCFDPPAVGGGLAVGIDDFKPVATCAAPAADPARAALANCSFDGNVASDLGGGAAVRGGRLSALNTTFTANAATGSVDARASLYNAPGGLGAAVAAPAGTARGGGLFVGGAAGAAPGAPVVATIVNSSFTLNTAASAGGGLFFDGSSSSASSLLMAGGFFTDNAVPTGGGGGGGAGGGVALASPGFNLSGLAFGGNAGRFGGGAFVAADFDAPAAAPPRDATLERLTFEANNTAARGPDAFWVRASSPSAALACPGCALGGADAAATAAALAAASGTSRVATEALGAALAGAPPAEVQSNEPAPPFSVSLLDYYGTLSSSDSGGSCDVSTAAPGVTLPGAGRTAPVAAGAATFERLTVTGGIGSAVALALACSPRGVGASPAGGGLLPAGAAALPPLPLSVSVGVCPRGKEPPAPGTEFGVCQPCGFGRFSFGGGRACEACPAGGLCPGGVAGEATPVKAYAGYWRSSNESDVPLFPCPMAEACMGVSAAHPEWAGDAAGDAACVAGTRGPLCGVCRPAWYKFGGKCKPCSGIGAGKVMVAAACVVLALFLLAIFARSWGGTDAGPGPLTKVKLATTHLQLLALLRDFDVAWPAATLQALGWADALNVGVSLTAPECLVPSWSFWHYYASSLGLPVAAVALCLAVFFVAGAVARSASRRAAGRAPPPALDDAEGGPTPATPPPTPPTARRASAVQQRCWKNALWLVTLLYPRAAQAALQLFSLSRLDTGTYLSSDLGVLVRPVVGPNGLCPGGVAPSASGLCPLSRAYRTMIPIGATTLACIAFGLPALFFGVLWKSRGRLDQPDVMRKYAFLYCGYRMVYWESVDTVRKLAIAAIPVFIAPQPGGSVQALAGQAIMVGTAVVGLAVRPYAAPEDNWLLVGSSIVLWLILLSGGALKWARLSDFQMLALSGVQMALSVAIAALVAGLAVWRFGASGVAKARKAWRAAGRLARRVLRRGGGGGGEGGGNGRVAPEPSPSSSSAGFADRLASKLGGGGGAGGKAVRLEEVAAPPPPPPPPPPPLATAGSSADMATALLGSGGSGASGGSATGTPRTGAAADGTTPRASLGAAAGLSSTYGPPGHTPPASEAGAYRATGTPRGY